ncbi:hypothetical protein CO046_01400 [Candidatus Peregrinibacteria bacterium CG_4_9_14_0_2_um_filter_53_11]|nr:MAG: hypothetical protein CO046_01400 [Candidatus Peregrinibacteria bacterium CG_4_9_14_0_2_um_filter_53_11]
MIYDWNSIGHTKQLSYLEQELRTGTPHHAYLFVGPEKIGKFSIAKTFASIVQCQNNYCHTCSTCAQIKKNSHLDTILIADDGSTIKVAAMRDVIDRLSRTSQSNYKVILIENVDRFTPEAANALLKTLEEPTGKTIFLFTATYLRTILPTITSRMRLVHFQKPTSEELEAGLRQRFPEVDEDTLIRVIGLSLGMSGRAIELLEDQDHLLEIKDLYEEINFLYTSATTAKRMTQIQELAKDPQRLRNFLDLFTTYLHQQLHGTSGDPAAQAHVITLLEATHRVNHLLERNVNPRLLLEELMITI